MVYLNRLKYFLKTFYLALIFFFSFTKINFIFKKSLIINNLYIEEKNFYYHNYLIIIKNDLYFPFDIKVLIKILISNIFF